jgi:hypothetical protein
MKNFNKIMGSFNNVVKKLEALSAKKRIQKKRMQDTIKSIEINIKDVSKEEAAASEVAAKLKELFTSSKIKENNGV